MLLIPMFQMYLFTPYVFYLKMPAKGEIPLLTLKPNFIV